MPTATRRRPYPIRVIATTYRHDTSWRFGHDSRLSDYLREPGREVARFEVKVPRPSLLRIPGYRIVIYPAHRRSVRTAQSFSFLRSPAAEECRCRRVVMPFGHGWSRGEGTKCWNIRCLSRPTAGHDHCLTSVRLQCSGTLPNGSMILREFNPCEPFTAVSCSVSARCS